MHQGIVADRRRIMETLALIARRDAARDLGLLGPAWTNARIALALGCTERSVQRYRGQLRSAEAKVRAEAADFRSLLDSD